MYIQNINIIYTKYTLCLYFVYVFFYITNCTKMSTGEAIYNLVELLIEIAINDYVKTWKRTDEKIWKYLEENRKEQIECAKKWNHLL